MELKLLHRTPGRGGFATPPGYGVDDPHDRPWWTRPGFILSGLFLLAVLVLGAGLLFFHDTPGGQQARPTIPAVPAAPARAACKPSPAHPPTLPLAPGRTQWRQIGAVKAPVVDGLGPAAAVQVSNPISGATGQLPTCYAPGPGGALLAAANWLAAGTDSALVDSAIREL